MSEVFEALSLLEKERGIPVDFMVDRIKKAIVTACKNSYGNEDTVINMDPETGVFEVYLRKTVVEDVEEPGKEILLEKAREIDPTATAGDTVSVHLNTKEFGRIAAQTARNIIRQGIRDGERGQMMQEFQSKHQELVTALVERIDPRTGAATLRIGKAEAVLPKSEQVGGEELKEGDHVKVYVVDVRETEKGPRAMISRTHPDLVKRLFETEVPEIYDGTVEIKAVSRGRGPAPSWPSSATTRTWTRSARASARVAPACPASSTSWAARRSTLWNTATTRRNLSLPRSPRRRSSPS